MIERRPAGRKAYEIRPVILEAGINLYAEGSVLIKAGNTQVICTASIEKNVPPWLAGKGQGWITAEYSMLPRATHTRSKRDRTSISGRTQEIQRLIGRALRTTVDLKTLGEISILIDCDVIQADGGTRTASITGACVALGIALRTLPEVQLVDTVAAVSVGMKDGQVLLDLDYEEDSNADVDMNFVVTGKGHFVEVQGTAEKKPFTREDMKQMTDAALQGIAEIRKIQLQALESQGKQI